MSDHAHRTPRPSGSRELSLALVLTLTIAVVEVVAGLISGSMALLADSGHMLTDSSALALGLFASWIAARPATSKKTYGYYRTEILAALVNGVALWLLVIWIFARAIARLRYPPSLHTGPMLLAASVGLAANLASANILRGAESGNLNIRGVRLHVLSDTLGSVSVIIAALLMRWKGWVIADPLASLLIGVLIAASSWSLVRQAVNVLLEATPAHLNLAQVTEAMRQVRGVREVHDVHVWTITTGMDAMSGHVVVDELAAGPVIIEELNRLLAERFRLAHTTFQLEPRRLPCDAKSA
ncbi:MAG: cation transporter [Candidatus Omnitrophica bacterium]|nr:cation transporter [Candidatus Omnitrophota bacterium]